MHPGVHSVNSIKVEHYSQITGYPVRVSRYFYVVRTGTAGSINDTPRVRAAAQDDWQVDFIQRAK